MSIEFNHTIIPSQDNVLSATFYADILGLPPPFSYGPFIVVKTHNHVSLDFAKTTKDIQPRHYAFLVSELEFDEILGRICKKNINYWADHRLKNLGVINHNDNGRGLYFLDPNGHYLEVLTKPYGSGA